MDNKQLAIKINKILDKFNDKFSIEDNSEPGKIKYYTFSKSGKTRILTCVKDERGNLKDEHEAHNDTFKIKKFRLELALEGLKSAYIEKRFDDSIDSWMKEIDSEYKSENELDDEAFKDVAAVLN